MNGAPLITEAFPWESAPGYLIRDRDRVFGSIVRQRLRAMGIRDKPIAENVWITSLSLARRIYAKCCSPTRATITELALTGLWTRTRPCVGPFRGLAGCVRLYFSVHTGRSAPLFARLAIMRQVRPRQRGVAADAGYRAALAIRLT